LSLLGFFFAASDLRPLEICDGHLEGVSAQRQFTPVAWLMLATLCTAISDWQELDNIFPSLVLFGSLAITAVFDARNFIIPDKERRWTLQLSSKDAKRILAYRANAGSFVIDICNPALRPIAVARMFPSMGPSSPTFQTSSDEL
jgi:hypothetical protein